MSFAGLPHFLVFILKHSWYLSRRACLGIIEPELIMNHESSRL